MGTFCHASGTALEEVEERSYGFFSSRSDHVNELLEKGFAGKASVLWNREQDYFKASEKRKDKECSQALSEALLKTLDPRVKSQCESGNSFVWPVQREQWHTVKQLLTDLDKLSQVTEKHMVLKYTGHQDSIISRLKQSKDSLVQQFTNGAAEAFASFSLSEETNFFVEYPVKLETDVFLNQNRAIWLPILKKLPPDKILAFANQYRKQFFESDLSDIGTLYTQRILSTGTNQPSTFPRILDVVKHVKEIGLPLKTLPDVKVQVIDITSKRVSSEGPIEFPLEIDADLPFNFSKTGLDNAFDTQNIDNVDILVLLDRAVARNDRKIGSYNKIGSKVQSGTRTVPNPQHPLARALLTQAQLDLQNVRQQANYNTATCTGWGCVAVGIANGIAIGRANRNLEEAAQQLANTPMTFTEPVYESYEFNKASIDAHKIGTFNYYIIDKASKSYYKGTIDSKDSKSFVVAYNIRNEDPDIFSHRSSTQTEDDILSFEQSPITIPLSKILSQPSNTSTRPLTSLADIRKDILIDKNNVITAVKAKTYTAVTQDDKRFDSVVAVFHPGGSQGAGFFVKDDLVVTNYHVIQDSKFVEMKLRNGSETFGKVIAQDITT